MLATNVEEQLPQLSRELLREAAIAALCGAEPVEAVATIGVEPALEGGNRVGARAVRARHAKPLLAQGAQRRGELTMRERVVHERANDRDAMNRDGLGVIG